MTRIFTKKKILYLLLLIILILLISIFFQARITTLNNENKDIVSVKKISKIEYSANINDIMKEYNEIIDRVGLYSTSSQNYLNLNEAYINKLLTLKQKVLSLKAPSFEYRDLHINLISSLSFILKYIDSQREDDKLTSIDLVEKTKESFHLIVD